MRENRLQVVSEGKEAARQTLKHGKQEGEISMVISLGQFNSNSNLTSLS